MHRTAVAPETTTARPRDEAFAGPPRRRDSSDDLLTEKPLSLKDAMLGGSASSPGGWKGWLRSWLNKGDLSNIATFCIFLLGLILRSASDNEGSDTFAGMVLSCGLFGFSGGITNWLAVKMLFEKVGMEPYYLWGSGVIPRQFIAIRVAVKNMIIKMFFEKSFVEKYLNERAKGVLAGMDFGAKLRSAMDDPGFDTMLVTKLEELSVKPEGMLVQTMAPMFGGIELMVPVLKPFLAAFGEELLKALTEKLDVNDIMPIDKVIEEVELLLNEKLKEISPEMVKELLEEVIAEHLGWLVVWGNVFGGLIGFISASAGFGVV
eukprot:CAMPEP_0172597422 /NCGR_PEP_ID=MMETSP1068-20121228/17428_1 /TAXON_ID=35684 /ORGANISM="Pseudopedinella elastica, Strain CCMP716" /LENGTH=318 /DNA_ID=CAMNT_0013396943 /DNA_START=260 /DNA_END=1216 /DNA_ORIENTATION=+